MSELTEGKKAPQFSLPSSTGEIVSLDDYKDKNHIVLFFYPKSLTPG